MEGGYDCQWCGACCTSDREVAPGYVALSTERVRQLEGKALARLRRAAER